MTLEINRDLVRLTAFEKYILIEEIAGRPMVFPLVWEILGKLEQDAFSRSFREAASWHPMLTARIEKEHWAFDTTTDWPVQFGNDHDSSQRMRQINCRQSPLVRCFTWKQDDRQFVEFVFHHIASDGISAIEFCGDVFSLYDRQWRGDDDDSLRRPNTSILKRRRCLIRPKPGAISRWRRLKIFGRETVRFMSCRAEELQTAGEVPENPSPWHLCKRGFNAEETNRLRLEAHGLDASINDWCLVALLRTVVRWNREVAGSKPKKWLVANLPVQMRPAWAKHISVSNMIGFAFIARKPEMLIDGSNAIRSITDQRKRIQREGIAELFNAGIDLMRPIPGGLDFCMRHLRPATCVLTHVGDPVRRFRNALPRDEGGFPVSGNLTLIGAAGAAPTRPGTNVAGLVTSFAGKLFVCLRVEPSVFSELECEHIADIWASEIRGLLRE